MPCAPGMAVKRPGSDKPGCRASCRHRELVQGWHEAREAWERRRDEWAIGYTTERREYAERTGDYPPSFRDWLKAHAGQWDDYQEGDAA